MKRLLAHELKILLLRREFWFMIIISILYAGVAYFERVSVYGWQDRHLMISVQQASMLWISGTGYVYVLCLLPLFASISFSDEYYKECRANITGITITRQTYSSYYAGQLIMSLLSGFFFAIFPLVINLFFCVIAFPLKDTMPIQSGSIYHTSLARDIQYVLFPRLYMNFPLLDTIVHILLAGLLGSNIAGLSYTLTLHYQRNAVVAVGTTTIAYLIYSIGASTLKLYEYTPFHFLITAPEGYSKDIYIFILLMLVISSISFILYIIKFKRVKDVLI